MHKQIQISALGPEQITKGLEGSKRRVQHVDTGTNQLHLGSETEGDHRQPTKTTSPMTTLDNNEAAVESTFPSRPTVIVVVVVGAEGSSSA